MATCTSTTTTTYTLNLSKAEIELVVQALQYLETVADKGPSKICEAVLESIEETLRESEDIDDVQE